MAIFVKESSWCDIPARARCAFLFEQPCYEHNTAPVIRVLRLNSPSPTALASVGLLSSALHPINPPLAAHSRPPHSNCAPTMPVGDDNTVVSNPNTRPAHSSNPPRSKRQAWTPLSSTAQAILSASTQSSTALRRQPTFTPRARPRSRIATSATRMTSPPRRSSRLSAVFPPRSHGRSTR